MNYSHSVFDPYPTCTLWRVKIHFIQCQVKIKTHQKQDNSGLPGLGREIWFSLVAAWYSGDLCAKQTLGRWNLRIILFASLTGTGGLHWVSTEVIKQRKCGTSVPNIRATRLGGIGLCIYGPCKDAILPENAEALLTEPLSSSQLPLHFQPSLCLRIFLCVCVGVTCTYVCQTLTQLKTIWFHLDPTLHF